MVKPIKCWCCRYYKPDNPFGGDISDWYCTNEKSEKYGEYCDDEDSCMEMKDERTIY